MSKYHERFNKGQKMALRAYYFITILKIDHIQQWRMQEIWNLFHRQKYLNFKGFSTFDAGAAKAALSKIVYQFCTPKYSCFMRETVVKRISFFLKIFMLYDVYD